MFEVWWKIAKEIDMKKLLFISLLLFSNFSMSSNWIKTGTIDGGIIYYDKQSIIKSKNLITFWSKIDFNSVQSQGKMTYNSWMNEIQIDCQNRKFVSLQSVPMFNGKPIDSNLQPSQEWSSIIPDTPLSTNFVILCK